MEYLKLANGNLMVSRIALGCMRMGSMSVDELETLILTSIDEGINFFDHADIYGGGKSEELFGEVLKRNPNLRSKIIIQSKCGIRRGFYDSSKAHILESVDNILKRLGTDYLDILLIHRPDALMEPIEIAEAFDILLKEKKVRYFGVSNMNAMQVSLLQKHLNNKLIFNQLQLSIVHAKMIDSGINVNMKNDASIDHDGSILDYSRLNDITIQPWSVLQASWEEGSFLNNPKYASLNRKLNELGEKYNVTPSAIAIAWILRHPAKMQPIVGTTSPKHLRELCQATKVSLTRKEWYELYLSVDRKLP